MPAGLLLRHPNFRSLWSARAVSGLGDRFSLLAVPALALFATAATPGQVALLWSARLLPGTILAVPVAACLAGRSERATMMACDLLRSLLLGALFLLAAQHELRQWHLFFGVFAIGVLTTVFDVSAQTYTPRLVARTDYAEANSRFAQAASGADIAGPALAGLLIATAGAGPALVVDAVSFLTSLALLALIRDAASFRPAAPAGGPWKRLLTGVRFVAVQPSLRALVVAFGLFNLGGSIVAALWFPYLIDRLGLSMSAVGVLITIGGMAALGAALTARRIMSRVKPRLLLRRSLVAIVAALWLAPLAARGYAVPVLIAYQIMFGSAVVLFTVTAATVRQLLTPLDYQGRVYAVVYTCSLATVPIGGFLASTVAALASTATAVFLGAVIASISLITLRPLTGTAVAFDRADC